MARVLVVDDEEGLRSFLVEALAVREHEVDEAGDGVDAVARLGKRSYHVVVTNLKMPRMDGMALLKWLRTEQPEVEVILLTAHGSVDTAVEAMKLGAFDFLEKPLEGPDALRLLVARAAERHALRAFKEEADTDAELPLTDGDPEMEPVVAALRKVAKTDATVLLAGESGTGKEVAARALHRWSRRNGGPFVAVNCAALSESLLESELFGHERGAFTGANARRRGRIELADGGTFFLDEVGELKPALQAKLLRVVQERRFERVGGNRTVESDVRWIAATNRDLQQMVADGSFREDLYHRLAVFPVHLPPLRQRRQDILPLAKRLVRDVARRLGRPSLTLGEGAERLLAAAPWPGNIRELANALERAAILADGHTLDETHFAPLSGAANDSTTEPGVDPGARSLAELERVAIGRALAECGGNRREAAEALGIGLRTLYDKLKRYGLK